MEIRSRHVAFIRNVMIGRAALHRDVLIRICLDAGAIDPRSHLATGDVSFDWDEGPINDLVDATQVGVARTMGRFAPVFVRSVRELHASVDSRPFRITPIHDVGHRCVTFTETSASKLELPVVSPREDAYIFACDGRDVMSVTRLVKGRGGNVNRIVEKALRCRDDARLEHHRADREAPRAMN